MQWELAGSLPKVSEACHEFVESSLKVIGSLLERRRGFARHNQETCRKFARGCQEKCQELGRPGARREFARSSSKRIEKLIRSMSGVHRKKTERLVESSPKICRELRGSCWT
ncbi:hypothetical protein GW17_00043312 [Ensete ventricosum]|nr:hypothetical protein GW17_00043312 [Ensete ventricosum]